VGVNFRTYLFPFVLMESCLSDITTDVSGEQTHKYRKTVKKKQKDGTIKVYTYTQEYTPRPRPQVSEKILAQVVADFKAGVPRKRLGIKYGISLYMVDKTTRGLKCDYL
jgi:hypothetical protein